MVSVEALREEPAEAVAARERVVELVGQRVAEPNPSGGAMTSLAQRSLEAVMVEGAVPIENVDIPAASSSPLAA